MSNVGSGANKEGSKLPGSSFQKGVLDTLEAVRHETGGMGLSRNQGKCWRLAQHQHYATQQCGGTILAGYRNSGVISVD